MAMAAAAWDDEVEAHMAPEPPEELTTLLTHLTDHGRARFSSQLAEAMTGPDPVVTATRVFRSWWVTLYLRSQPGYREAMSRPVPQPGEVPYQTTAELKALLGL